MSASSLPLPQGKSVSLKQFVSHHINEIGLLVVIAILYLVFSLNAPGFISLNNQMNVLRDAATIGIAAWAMTLIIISGEIDVSVGPMVAFVSVCLAFLLQFEVPLAIACLLVLLLGALMGTLAGVLRGVFNVPSFVATLGLWSALRGMGLFMTNALPVPIDENEVLDWLGGQFLGVPVSALSYEDGAFISCGVGTAYEGILRGEVSGSDNVLVVGLGPVGMMGMMLAKGRGAKRIIGVDMLPERLAMAKQLGVMDHGYLATTEGLPQIIAELTHGGADVALDCSGNAAGRLLALQSTADWGRVVYIGETGKVEFEVSADLMHHQRRIIGSWVTSLFHMEKCAHDLTDWKLWPRNAITHRFSLEQAGDAYALMASGKCGKVVINFPD
ncbi:zinc-binding dehydrogenase [Escherichia coli]|nr:zinc-binding dehydrogenase [Escherichia coli]EEC7384080.1 zinc-binding dehydrogenase [Escherichia coli]EEC7559050.1 zinc-binding dehydrogenase [Escherichia coli]EEC7569678.1 zinc-binding dehydrogenase [Escherichia coli]EEC8256968.1 zinc-binding dehydrogenase [Escherichia coli]EEC8532894.1 zinc-binding dehydrogenase [Escherichia coli]